MVYFIVYGSFRFLRGFFVDIFFGTYVGTTHMRLFFVFLVFYFLFFYWEMWDLFSVFFFCLALCCLLICAEFLWGALLVQSVIICCGV